MRTTNELLETVRNTLEQRGRQHGDKHALFKMVAARWNHAISVKTGVSDVLSPSDVASMMVDLKLSRAMLGGVDCGLDNYVDAIGYVAIAGELRDAELLKEEREEHV